MKWLNSTLFKRMFLLLTAFLFGSVQDMARAQAPAPPPAVDPSAPAPLQRMQARITNAQRQAAAARLAAARKAAQPQIQGMAKLGTAFMPGAPTSLTPLGVPDYMSGIVPNYANSPLLRKFIHTLPGLTAANANDLGQYIPVAVADKTTYPGSDYYQIGVTDFTQKLHADLPAATKLRGYKDLQATGADAAPHYLGPLILAQRDRPVRVKFSNLLGTGTAGNLFLPVDKTAMGAGMGPDNIPYTENRAELHLHGGVTPWISDGTPHQWITPAGENAKVSKGVSQRNVPDMPDPGAGSATYFYTNQQSGRLMFYHDHSYGLTRLNVYAGEAAGYLITDPVEDSLIDAGIIPGAGAGVYRYGIPLIIQDKTFVPDLTTLAAQDPTWDNVNWGGPGNLWFPHVYMPNQNPADITGANAMGRWDYGPWFWPPVTGLKVGLTPGNPLAVPPTVDTPGTPNPSLVPESFMDTPIVNGTPYPTLTVLPQAYRFRILNAANDRSWNLSLFQADPLFPTEVKMVPAAAPVAPALPFPADWPTDGRAGGVPDPSLLGPPMIQIGTEGGLLPAPAVIPPMPVGYNYNRRDIVVLNIATHALLLGPAERADIVVDFSAYAGKTLILYNDSPAPVPAFDTRYDYYTGDPDQTSTGGAPPTPVGYGPNTRTVMQFKVAAAAPAPAYNLPALQAAFTGSATVPSAFAASQPVPIVPQASYSAAMNMPLTDTWSTIQATQLNYAPLGSAVVGTQPMLSKCIQELFELDYGRMNATLGTELPFTNFATQTTVPLGYIDPITEDMNDGQVQIWKITHNGVDTHAIHFHLFNVQLINRVGWDGAVRFPDANELGWKETVRMNPLEDAIVAMQPIAPQLPFDVRNSFRPEDPTTAVGQPITVGDLLGGAAVTIANPDNIDFGWEYVWHCHLLGHEENDMMRPIKFNVADYTISGLVTDTGGNPMANVTITPTGGAPTVTTAADGTYSFIHSAHWNGSISASLGSNAFSPASLVYSNLSGSQPNQNFTAATSPMVLGMVTTNTVPPQPLAGVTVSLNGAGLSAVTGSTGQYSIPVTSGWAGTAYAALAGYTFAPLAAAVASVTAPSFVNFVATPVVVISGQITAGANPLPGVVLTFSNGAGTTATDASGNYTMTVPKGWTGVVSPTLAGFAFAPTLRTYTNVQTDQPNQAYVGTAVVVISGKVASGLTPLAGAVMTFSTGQVVPTDINGNYKVTLPAPYTGTLTPTKVGYVFTPVSLSYAAVTTDQLNQNFLDGTVVVISGQVTINGIATAGVPVNFTGGFTATTDVSGNYSQMLPSPWTGTSAPAVAGVVFAPVAYTYTAASTNQTAQNFSGVKVVVISGQVAVGTTGLAGATVTFTPGTTATTDANGNYTMTLLSGWSGTAVASKAGYYITPLSLAFTNVTVDQINQNFVAVNAITIYGLVSQNTVPATPLAGVTLTFSNGGGTAVTDAAGIYTQYIPIGWTGTITPSSPTFVFTPTTRSFTNVTRNLAGQNFTAQAVAIVNGQITSNGVGLAGVRVGFGAAGSATTDAAGNYTMTVPAGFTGTATPTMRGRIFSPAATPYTSLTGTATQNYTTVQSITGRVRLNRAGLVGVTLTLSNGTTTTTSANGSFTLLVPTGFTGTMTPSLTGRTFTPALFTYTSLITNMAGQNITAQ